MQPYERLPSIPGNVLRTALAGPKEVAVKQASRWASGRQTFLSVLSVSEKNNSNKDFKNQTGHCFGGRYCCSAYGKHCKG